MCLQSHKVRCIWSMAVILSQEWCGCMLEKCPVSRKIVIIESVKNTHFSREWMLWGDNPFVYAWFEVHCGMTVSFGLSNLVEWMDKFSFVSLDKNSFFELFVQYLFGSFFHGKGWSVRWDFYWNSIRSQLNPMRNTWDETEAVGEQTKVFFCQSQKEFICRRKEVKENLRKLEEQQKQTSWQYWAVFQG